MTGGRAGASSDAQAEVDEREFGAAERLSFFSDAVVAIALTLLALDLPVPKGQSAREVLHSLGQGWHAYLAFVISFLVIARYWTGHHHVFRYLKRMDGPLLWLNVYWLFILVVMPWLTNTLAGPVSDSDVQVDDFSGQAFRYALYAFGQVLANGLFAAMLARIRHARLDDGQLPPGAWEEAIGRSLAVGASFAVSIPIFFIWPWAWVLWIGMPLLLGLGARRWRQTRDRRRGSTG